MPSCRWCREAEANEWLLDINHGPDSCRAIRGRYCTAQMLTRNHVIYCADRLANGEPDFTEPNFKNRRRHPLSPKGRELRRAQLIRDVERATALWEHTGHDLTWLDDARALIDATAPQPPPEHGAMGDTVQEALL